MTSTTIKVSVQLRDRLALLAKAERTTLAGAIERSLDMASDAQFWASVAATMGEGVVLESEREAPALSDGLDPVEDWSGVW